MTRNASPDTLGLGLKPCPFDGGRAYIGSRSLGDGWGVIFYGQCGTCACEGSNCRTEAEASVAWNRRASPPAPAREGVDTVLFDHAWKMVEAIRGGGTPPFLTPDEAANNAAPYLLERLDERNAAASPPAREEAPAEGAGEKALDGTDAAHPAWWRGHEQTAQVLCQKVVSILDGEGDGSGVANDPWESVRRRLIALRNRTSEPEAGAVMSMAFEPVEHPLYVVSEAARRQLVRAAGWIEKEAYDASGHDDPEDEGLDEAARYLRSMFDLSDEALGLVRNSMDELVPAHPATADKPDGYASAFYEIAAMLGIGARPDYPADVWQKEIKPALQRLIATAGVK